MSDRFAVRCQTHPCLFLADC